MLKVCYIMLKVYYMQTFTSHIKVLRAQAGITQEELAEKVGVVRQTIAYLERGEYVPSLTLAWQIAKALGVSIDQAFSFEE
jgi:putative transcriptional regulator